MLFPGQYTKSAVHNLGCLNLGLRVCSLHVRINMAGMYHACNHFTNASVERNIGGEEESIGTAIYGRNIGALLCE